MGARVYATAQVEEDTAVGTGFSGDEKDEVVRPGKGFQVLVPVRHLRADGVMDRHVDAEGTHPVTDFRIFRGTLRRLGKDLDGLGEVDFPETGFQHSPVLHHEGVAAHLAEQAQNLRVPDFSEDDECPVEPVRMQAGIGFPDMLLQLQHDRAGAVDDLQAAVPGFRICLRRFAVGPDENGFAFGDDREGCNGPEAFRAQAFEFGFVVDDGTEGLKMVAVREESFRAGNGTDDAAAKTGTGVDFDRYHDRAGASRMPNLPWMTPRAQTSSSWRVIWVLSIT